METKLGRIADKSAREHRPIFTSLYHLLNEEMLMKCHRELAGNKAVVLFGKLDDAFNVTLNATILC